jgi:hypothetical protein
MVSKFFIIFIALFSLTYSVKRATLPDDEIEALKMISRHELDSSLWDIIEPFYYQPISVPYGELGILTQLFPEYNTQFPETEVQLAKYVPWGKKNIIQFFSDWPELLYFKPILDFSMNVPVKSGRTCVMVDRSGVSENVSQRVQFSLEPVTWFSAEGRFALTENIARWKHRKVSILPGNLVAFQAGNIAPLADPHRLVSGRFSGQEQTESTVKENWLYGDKKGWNTFVIDISPELLFNKIHAQTFVHKRKYEAIAGLSTNVHFTKNIGSQLDLIGMDLKETDDTLAYGVSTTKFNFLNWNTEISLAASIRTVPAIPVRVGMAYLREQDNIQAEIIYIPEGFCASLSKTLLDFTSAENFEKSTESGFLSCDLAWRHRFLKYAIIAPSLSLKMSDLSLMYVNPGVFLSVQQEKSKLIVEYQRFQLFNEENKKNVDNISIFYTLGPLKKVNIQTDIIVRHVINKNWYISSMFKPQFKPTSALEISPGLKLKKNSGDSFEMSLILSHTLHFFDAIYSDLLLEKYTSHNNKKGPLTVNAKMWFLF